MILSSAEFIKKNNLFRNTLYSFMNIIRPKVIEFIKRLLLAVPGGCLQFVIVVFPDHTTLLFLRSFSNSK